jgi:hypothetical protein
MYALIENGRKSEEGENFHKIKVALVMFGHKILMLTIMVCVKYIQAQTQITYIQHCGKVNKNFLPF